MKLLKLLRAAIDWISMLYRLYSLINHLLQLVLYKFIFQEYAQVSEDAEGEKNFATGIDSVYCTNSYRWCHFHLLYKERSDRGRRGGFSCIEVHSEKCVFQSDACSHV